MTDISATWAAEAGSDKFFWHRYGEVYTEAFSSLPEPRMVVEYGVAAGDSIRWLRGRFPAARIVGLDIIPVQESWPRDERIEYHRVDQGEPEEVRRLLASLATPLDLVIEDGSHDPVHQRTCLLETLPVMSPGGIYILEDLHTSAAELRREGLMGTPPDMRGRRRPRRTTEGVQPFVNSLSLLLALERARAFGRALDEETVIQLTRGSAFGAEDVRALDARVEDVRIHRRATLPLSCYHCGGTAFDVSRMRCACGTPLMTDDDSMTAVVHIAAAGR